MCHSNCCKGGGMCTFAMVTKILLIVGGVNWGLIGVGMLMGSSWNVLNMLLGSWPMAEAVVYVLVGVSAVLKMCGGCRCHKCMSGVCMEHATENKAETKM